MAEIVDNTPLGDASEVTRPDDTTPEKLRGKSASEIADLYTQLEKQLGRQAEEIGSLRALADQTLAQPPAAADDPTEDLDFFGDPMGSVQKVIDMRLDEKFKPLDEATKKQREAAVAQQLDQKFPDWRETATSEEFADWITSSKIRRKLWAEADSADYDAANELFSLWADLGKGKVSSEEKAKKAVARDRKLRAASTEKGAAGIDPRKILSREDIIALRVSNPNRYNDLLPDIRKAYEEGRTRKG